MINWLSRKTAPIGADRAGNLTVEFAFLLPVLLLLGFGALELGNVLLQHLRMAGAARAGLHYALQDHMTAIDAAGITQAARAGAGSGTEGYSITPRRFCACGEAEVACSSTCGDGSLNRTYVEVAITGTATPLTSYPLPIPTWQLSVRQSRRLN